MNTYHFNEDVIRRKVLQFMHQLDIFPVDTNEQFLILDDNIHRFRTVGDDHSEKSGAYCIHIDNWPGGFVQDWRKGDAVYWSFNRNDLDDEGKSYFDDETYQRNLELSKKHQEKLKQQREEEKANASERARITFQDTTDKIDTHFPYLIDKNIQPYGVKFSHPEHNDCLMLVPIYSINGRIQSLQYIRQDGGKKFFPNAPTKGGFFPFGLGDNPHVILVGEGYATMATVHQITGLPAVATMTCGNLAPVCLALMGKFPNANIIITADNDHKKQPNAGITSANKACADLHLQGVVFPDFSTDEDGTDWNDYALLHGVDFTARILMDKINFALLPPKTQAVLSRVEQINAQDLRHKVFPEIKWAVPGFLPAGCSILAGGPKIGKSILALHLSEGVAIGGCVLGKIEVQQGDVLYLALEDTQRRLQERIDRSDLPDDVDLSRLTLATVVPRQHEGGMEYLQWWLELHRNARLVIIDTLQKFRRQLSGKGDRYSQDYDVISEIKALSDRFNVPILIIHHLKKAMEDDYVNEVSGSQGIAGAVDTILILKRARTESIGTLHRTGRDVEEKDFLMRIDGFGWVIEGDAELLTTPEWKRQILDYLKEHDTVSPSLLAQAVNISIEAAGKNLQRLMKEGKIQRIGHGKYKLADK